MKVSLNPITIVSNSKSFNKRKSTSGSSNPVQVATNTKSLQSYYYNDQVSFGSNESADKKPKTKAEVEAEKLKIQKRNKDLQAKLDSAKNWDYSWNRNYYNNRAEEECAKLPWYKWGAKSDIRDDYDSRFWKEYNSVQETLKQEPLIKELIAGNAIDEGKLKEMEKGLAASEARAKMLSAEGGMDNRIASYQNEKDQLVKRFLDPLADEAAGIKTPVPPCIALYGATGTGKTTFIDALATQSGAHVDPLETDTRMFQTDFNKKIKLAAERYHNPETKGQRTIILINEAEDFLGESSDQYVKSNVRCFKSKLDTISQIPLHGKDEARGAATVFITTNYPHLIHPDLRTRDGKMGEFIAINPPEKADIEAVLKHYVKKSADAIKLREDADKFNINVEEVPYDKIADNKQPTSELGAYSNDRLRKIVQKAVDNYISNPERPFATQLGLVFNREKRDLEPSRYNEFVRIYKMISPLQPNELEDLEGLEKMSCLDEAGAERLKYFRKIVDAEKIAKTVAETAIDVAKKIL